MHSTNVLAEQFGASASLQRGSGSADSAQNASFTPVTALATTQVFAPQSSSCQIVFVSVLTQVRAVVPSQATSPWVHSSTSEHAGRRAGVKRTTAANRHSGRCKNGTRPEECVEIRGIYLQKVDIGSQNSKGCANPHNVGDGSWDPGSARHSPAPSNSTRCKVAYGSLRGPGAPVAKENT